MSTDGGKDVPDNLADLIALTREAKVERDFYCNKVWQIEKLLEDGIDNDPQMEWSKQCLTILRDDNIWSDGKEHDDDMGEDDGKEHDDGKVHDDGMEQDDAKEHDDSEKE